MNKEATCKLQKILDKKWDELITKQELINCILDFYCYGAEDYISSSRTMLNGFSRGVKYDRKEIIKEHEIKWRLNEPKNT